jgi:hypothetical protein
MPDTFPTKRVKAKTPTLRKKKTPRGRKERSPNQWTRERLDYAQLEAAKHLVAAITYKEVPPSKKSPKGYLRELRVSVLPWSKAGYVDLRFYINGGSTGQGLLVHLDKWPALLAACIQADREVTAMRDRGLIGDGT